MIAMKLELLNSVTTTQHGESINFYFYRVIVIMWYRSNTWLAKDALVQVSIKNYIPNPAPNLFAHILS